jgi:hypothetical protein
MVACVGRVDPCSPSHDGRNLTVAAQSSIRSSEGLPRRLNHPQGAQNELPAGDYESKPMEIHCFVAFFAGYFVLYGV